MRVEAGAIHPFAAGNRHGAAPVTAARLTFDALVPPARGIAAEIARAVPGSDPGAWESGCGAPVDATVLAGIVVHLAAAVAALAGDRGAPSRVLATHDARTVDVLLGHGDAVLARNAVRVAADLLSGVYSGHAAAALDRFVAWAAPRTVVGEDVFLVAAAEARGVPWRRSPCGEGHVLLGEGIRLQRMWSNMTPRTTLLGVDVCTSKWLTQRVLHGAGLPTTMSHPAADAAAAIAAAEDVGYPVVVKPVYGSRGKGVVCNLATPAEVAEAFVRAQRHGAVIVERFVTGADHRMLVVDGRFVSCTRRSPAALVADGVHGVADLVAIENARPERRPGPGRRLHPLPLDGEADRVLGRQHLTRDAVPAAGSRVLLRYSSNWSEGGTVEPVTGRVHPANARLAERVAALVGMDVVGVDLLTTDISRPFDAVGATINEVQRQPAIGGLGRAADGGEGDMRRLLDHVCPPGRPCRVPVVAVAGSAAGSVARRLADALAAEGWGTGHAGAAGCTVRSLRRSAADMRGRGLALLLDDPMVEMIVLEIDPAALLEDGLGRDRLDVLVLAGAPPPAEALALLHVLARDGAVHVACPPGTQDTWLRATLDLLAGGGWR